MRLKRKSKPQLVRAARKAAKFAYCPYSNFRVGAAVLADGKIYVGSNVENASFGLTICAERVAIFKAISAGAKTIAALAIACVDAPSASSDQTRMPCGACRQVMAEFADRSFEVVVDGVGTFTMKSLLPRWFRL
jgi:cytidine deaminase